MVPSFVCLLNVPKLSNVFVSQKPQLTYRDISKAWTFDNSAFTTFDTKDMTTASFFAHCENYSAIKPHSYVYYSRPITDFPLEVQADIGNLSVFDVTTYKGREVEAHVWLGMVNVTSNLHYDASYNFYVQLYGHKRFVLYPPAATKHLYLYPMMHHSFRQSQIDMARLNFGKFPKARYLVRTSKRRGPLIHTSSIYRQKVMK